MYLHLLVCIKTQVCLSVYVDMCDSLLMCVYMWECVGVSALCMCLCVCVCVWGMCFCVWYACMCDVIVNDVCVYFCVYVCGVCDHVCVWCV